MRRIERVLQVFDVQLDPESGLVVSHKNHGSLDVEDGASREASLDRPHCLAGFHRRAAPGRSGRDALSRAKLGKNPEIIEPLVPVDLVVDHSVQVDFAGTRTRWP